MSDPFENVDYFGVEWGGSAIHCITKPDFARLEKVLILFLGLLGVFWVQSKKWSWNFQNKAPHPDMQTGKGPNG